jgi:hypothetical protein
VLLTDEGYIIKPQGEDGIINHVLCIIFSRVSTKDKWEATIYDANVDDVERSDEIKYGRSAHTHDVGFGNTTEMINVVSNLVVGYKVKYRIGQLGIHNEETVSETISGDGICLLGSVIIMALMVECKYKIATNGAQVVWNVNRALDHIHSRPGALEGIINAIHKCLPIPPIVCMKPPSIPESVKFAHKIRASVTGHSGPLNRDLARVKTHLLKHSYDKQRSRPKLRLKFQHGNRADLSHANSHRSNFPVQPTSKTAYLSTRSHGKNRNDSSDFSGLTDLDFIMPKDTRSHGKNKNDSSDFSGLTDLDFIMPKDKS